MLSAEDVPGMVQFFHICERDKKRSLPSTPFLRAWLVAELGAKNRAIRDPAVHPQIPTRQGITCRFQNRDFSDFCQFRSSENRVSETWSGNVVQRPKWMLVGKTFILLTNTVIRFKNGKWMRGTKLNLNPVQKTNEKFQNATPNQKVGRKADYAKSISLVPELRV